MEPCKRKTDTTQPSNAFESHHSSRDNDILDAASASRPGRRLDRKRLFQTVLVVLLALSNVLLLVHILKPTTPVLTDAGVSRSSASAVELPRDCRVVTAEAQFTRYLNELAHAHTVHVAATSTSRANFAMDMCCRLRVVSLSRTMGDSGPQSFSVDGECRVRLPREATRVNVVLKRGQGYKWVKTGDGESVERTGSCIDPYEVPPLHALVNASRSAKWITAAPNASESDRTLQFEFAGEPYRVTEQSSVKSDEVLRVCEHKAGRSIDKVLRVESQDVLVALAIEGGGGADDDSKGSEATGELVDTTNGSSLLQSCPDLPTTVRVPKATTAESLMSDKANEAVALESLNAKDDDECPCRHGGNKTCLFVHGIGVREDVGVQDDFEDYWGKQVKRSLPCCAVVKFTHFDTVDPPWYSREVSRELCRAAIAVSRNETYRRTDATSRGVQHSERHDSINSSSTTTMGRPASRRRGELKDMVLIAHSTGNLHLAAALLYGDCYLDRATSRWLAIQGPMDGTNTANRVIDECQQPNSTWDDLAKKVLVEFELCPITGSTKSLALRGSKAVGSCLDALYAKAGEVFRAQVSAVMCGVSPVGIASSSSPRFVALSKFSNHSSALNDGAVEFDSCRGGVAANAFAPSFKSRFYKAEINHDDGRLIHGDGAWGETRKPLKWLQCQF